MATYLNVSIELLGNLLMEFRGKEDFMDYEPSYKEFATIFKALSDETRLRVIDMLSCKECPPVIFSPISPCPSLH